MSDETPTDDQDNQTNQTHIHRTAGNNYYEQRITHQPSNDNPSLLIQPDDEIDGLSITSDRLFKRRFWKDFDYEIREQTIAMKQMHNWTERELRHLFLSGWLQVNRMTGEVKAEPNQYMYRYGQCLLAYMTLYSANGIVLSSLSHGTHHQVLGASLGILAVWWITAILLNWLFFKPYEILARAKVRAIRKA
jgi:hypothetical protein